MTKPFDKVNVNGRIVHIDNRVGQGSTSEVYSGIIGRQQLAIKVFLPTSDMGSLTEDRAKEEIQITLSLRHPHLISALAGGYEPNSNRHYLVSPYYKGVAFDQYINQYRNVSPPDAEELVRRLLFQLSGALMYLHRKGIVHRDVKPANIIYSEGKKQFTLIDFGLARRCVREEKFPSSWDINGAPRFRSPEKWEDFHSATTADDCWSLGVIAYRLLNGVYPFDSQAQSESEERLREKIFYQLPARLSKVSPYARYAVLTSFLLRRDRRYRSTPNEIRTFTSGNAKSSLLQRESYRRKVPLRAIYDRLHFALEQTSEALLSKNPKVALICERLLFLDTKAVKSEATCRFAIAAIRWLHNAHSEGRFLSLSIHVPTVYCTSVAALALFRVRAWLELDAKSRNFACALSHLAFEALRQAQTSNGWPWFFGERQTHVHSTAWAAIALAEMGATIETPQILIKNLRTVDNKKSSSIGGHASRALSSLAVTKVSMTSAVKRPEYAHNVQFLRTIYPSAMRADIPVVEVEGISLSTTTSFLLRGVEKISWTNMPAALYASSYALNSASDPYFIDAALALIKSQHEHLRSGRRPLAYVQTSFGQSVKDVWDAIGNCHNLLLNIS